MLCNLNKFLSNVFSYSWRTPWLVSRLAGQWTIIANYKVLRVYKFISQVSTFEEKSAGQRIINKDGMTESVHTRVLHGPSPELNFFKNQIPNVPQSLSNVCFYKLGNHHFFTGARKQFSPLKEGSVKPENLYNWESLRNDMFTLREGTVVMFSHGSQAFVDVAGVFNQRKDGVSFLGLAGHFLFLSSIWLFK